MPRSSRVGPERQESTESTASKQLRIKGFKLWAHLKRAAVTGADGYDDDEEVETDRIFTNTVPRQQSQDGAATDGRDEKKYRTPDNMIRMILLGQEFQIHKNTFRDSDSRTLRRLRPQSSCPYYMAELSEKAEQQTYYLCQRPSAFLAIIMYMEGGLLTPPTDMSLDDFIDEVIFYELRNVDEAIEKYNDRFDSESDTDGSESESESEDEWDAEGGQGVVKEEPWLRKVQRVTHAIMDGKLDHSDDDSINTNVAASNDSGSPEKHQNHHIHTWQKVYTLLSTAVVFVSIVTFVMATMPAYRLETKWICSYGLPALQANGSAVATAVAGDAALDATAHGFSLSDFDFDGANDDTGGTIDAAAALDAQVAAVCYLGSPYFEWDNGVTPVPSGVDSTGFIDPDLKEDPVVSSLGGILLQSGAGFVADNTSTTVDNCVCIATETARLDDTLETIDYVCFIFFAVEALVRFLGYKKKKKWLFSWLNWVDIVALVPSVYGLILIQIHGEAVLTTTPDMIHAATAARGVDAEHGAAAADLHENDWTRFDQANALHIFRVVRIVRMFRLLRLSRYFVGITIFAKAINDSKMALFQLFVMIMIVSVIFATILFHIEHEDEEPFGTGFHSITYGIWWSIVTMSTLGYGDMVPQHWAGKLFGAVCALCGVLVIALPVPVFVENFQRLWDAHHLQENLRNRRKQKAKLDAKVQLQALTRPDSKIFSNGPKQNQSEETHDDHPSLLLNAGGPDTNHGVGFRAAVLEAARSNNKERRGRDGTLKKKAKKMASDRGGHGHHRSKSTGSDTVNHAGSSSRKGTVPSAEAKAAAKATQAAPTTASSGSSTSPHAESMRLPPVTGADHLLLNAV